MVLSTLYSLFMAPAKPSPAAGRLMVLDLLSKLTKEEDGDGLPLSDIHGLLKLACTPRTVANWVYWLEHRGYVALRGKEQSVLTGGYCQVVYLQRAGYEALLAQTPLTGS